MLLFPVKLCRPICIFIENIMDLKDNPFAKVFPSIEAAGSYAKKVKETGRTIFWQEWKHLSSDEFLGKDLLINLIVEEVFNFTICKIPAAFKKGTENHLLFLEDVSGSGKLSFDNIDTLELVLFERLLLENPSSHVITKNKSISQAPPVHVIELHCLLYLFECYRRLLVHKQNDEELISVIEKMIGFVVRNAATALKQPEVYEKQDLQRQVGK